MADATRFPLVHPEVSLDLPRAAFRTLRKLAPVLDAVDETDRMAVIEALFTRSVPERAADLLDDIGLLSDDVAREAFIEAAIDRGTPHDAWFGAAPVSVAARLVLGARRNPAARAVVVRALIRLGRRIARRARYDHRLLVAARPAKLDVFADAGRAVHGDAFVRAILADTEDGVLHAAILHHGPAVRLSACVDGRIQSRLYRPLASDLVRWDADAGGVSFCLARPRLVRAWTEALERAAGVALYHPRLAFTLKPLHERGSAWIQRAKLPLGVRDVEVVACELDDGQRFGVRCPNALDTLHERLGHGGYVYRATLRLRIDGARRPIDVTIELPNKLSIAEPRWEREIRATLDALGLTEPGALVDDLASLAPFVHPEWRWVELVGAPAFARALAAKLLVRVPSRRAGEPQHRRFGSMYTVHAIDGERDAYAVAEDAAALAHTVNVSALAHWRLDLAALARALREELALEEIAIDAPKGVLPIGILPAKGTSVVFFLLLAVVPEAQCKALREAVRKACTKGQVAVLLVGDGRTLHGGIAEIKVTSEEQLGGASVGRVVGKAAEELKIEDQVEPWRWGSRAAPLVFLKERREVWLGRVKLALTAGQVTAVETLAGGGAAWTSSWDLGKAISPNSALIDRMARKTLDDLDERVARSFEDAGVALPAEWASVIEMQRGRGYRLRVKIVAR